MNKTAEEIEEDPNPLEKAWVKGKSLFYRGYKITKECNKAFDEYSNCWLKIRKNGRILAAIEADYTRDYWLKFGLFNFLGGKDEQLVIFTYSGGVHCCYDYRIYDFDPGFRKIYDSTKYDSVNQIGNELFPVDIDNDGVYEFRRHVMAFDFFHASHADSVFPAAIFEYDKNRRQYRLANRKFGDFVMLDRERNLKWLERLRKSSGSESEERHLSYERYIVRAMFLSLVYAGREAEAWKYLDDNNNFARKEEYRKDVEDRLISDVTYWSIYPRKLPPDSIKR